MRSSKHHRKPRSRGGDGELRNISFLPSKKHSAFHLLFQNWEPERIAMELNRFYLDPDWELVAIRKEAK